MEESIVDKVHRLRDRLKDIEGESRLMMNHGTLSGEMKANIMLAVRHTEDAGMRLGKVCQYAEARMA